MASTRRPTARLRLRRFRAALALCLAALVGGCAGNAQDALGLRAGEALIEGAPPERSAIAADPRLVVFTTRNRVTVRNGTSWFGTDRAAQPTVAEVRLQSPYEAGLFSLAAIGLGDWSIDQVAVRPGGLQWPEAGPRRDVLIYVHGFNTSFDRAVLDAARLADGTGFRGETMLFTWPSRGALLDYLYDRDSAMWSRDAFERMLEELILHPAVGGVHIVAHSMGTMLAVESLRQLHARHGEPAAAKIGAVVLAAPDIDIDVFAASVRRIGRLADRITVLTAVNDRALGLVARVAGGVTRVGAAERDRLQAMGLRVIDASAHGGIGVNHNLFLSSEAVRGHVRRAIEEQAPLPVIGANGLPGEAQREPPPAAH